MNWNHLKMTFVDPHGGMGTGLTGWSPGGRQVGVYNISGESYRKLIYGHF